MREPTTFGLRINEHICAKLRLAADNADRTLVYPKASARLPMSTGTTICCLRDFGALLGTYSLQDARVSNALASCCHTGTGPQSLRAQLDQACRATSNVLRVSPSGAHAMWGRGRKPDKPSPFSECPRDRAHPNLGDERPRHTPETSHKTGSPNPLASGHNNTCEFEGG